MNKIVIQNAQFYLYYMLITADGIITEEEKKSFIDIVSKHNDCTKSYSQSVFNALSRFEPTQYQYEYNIEILKSTSVEVKNMTIKTLRELSFVDGSCDGDEIDFIIKVTKNLDI